MASLKYVNTESEMKEALAAAGDKLVVVDFYADWCGPCRMIAPKFQAFSEAYPSVAFFKVNVDEASELAEKYQVQGIPLFVFIKNGNKIDSFSGANEAKLKEKIDAYSSTS